MKRIFALSFVLVSVFAAVFALIGRFKTQRSSLAENREAPSEHFAFMRSYPDQTLDIQAYNEMLKEAETGLLSAKAQSTLSWQLEGPTNVGGRITALAIHPTNPNIIFAGCPGGGLFKTVNGGSSWTAVFDNQAFLSVSCVVFDPVNPSILYAGTGDPDTPFTVFVGNGVYKSTDGGNSWTNIGLGNTGVITQIVIHPSTTNIIYVSALGTPMLRDLNRGIYKSTNGGTSWSQVLSINNETGVSDLLMDYSDPNILYAAAWTRIRTNQESTGYSNTTRIYKSTNAGVNWSVLSSGLPATKLSRLGICMSKQNPQKLYVSVCDSTYNLQGIYVSTNGGSTFSSLPGVGAINTIYSGFGWYFGKIAVKPGNDNDLLVSGVEHARSIDGGQSFFINQGPWWDPSAPHADIHDIRFVNASTYILATDGGLYKTTDDGNNWTKIDNIPNTQYYRVNYNPFVANQYCGGTQDNGTNYGGFSFGQGNWFQEWGGDGFQPRLDFSNNQIRYAETQNGGLYVSTDGGSNYNGFTNGISGSDRRNWDMPYIFSAAGTGTMYTGTYRVYRNSTNPNDNWNPISNDLTDGIIYGARFHNITCLDNSTLNAQHLYAGTSDGNVWRSLNGGGSWTSIYAGLPDRYVTSVKASPNYSSNVYVTHSGYRYNEYIPHIHKSINNGTSWINISGNLPQTGINDLVVVPGYENVLFVATDIGVYYTQDGGQTWSKLGNNMPVIVVWDLEYNPSTKKLIAGTYARGIQTIDVSSLLTITGLTKPVSEELFSVYPNPAHDKVKVTLANGAKPDMLWLYNIEGKLIRQIGGRDEIDVSDLSPGIYTLLLEKGGERSQRKLYKQ